MIKVIVVSPWLLHEAETQRCSWKWIFLMEELLKNNCKRVYLIVKFKAVGPQLYWEWISSQVLFKAIGKLKKPFVIFLLWRNSYFQGTSFIAYIHAFYSRLNRVFWKPQKQSPFKINLHRVLFPSKIILYYLREIEYLE